ncbi:MAG: lasso RiPP family leader peptide-containing protein [Deltaproteobacteria bacterium]|nr:lasso RiPP family leader peptide-containing protein [Deltaproteobacteria bacterium]
MDRLQPPPESSLELGAILIQPQSYAQWTRPRLTRLGDARELTLGGSSGTGDSGNPTMEKTQF